MKFTSTLLVLFVCSLGYWLGVLTVFGLIAVSLGDCPTDPHPGGMEGCFATARAISISGMIIGIVGNLVGGSLLFRLMRRK